MDIILEKGTVIDPDQGIHGPMEVGIVGRRVAAVGARLERMPKTRVLDCSGLLIVPGLIDLHVHAYPGATDLSLDPDAMMLQGGVTTMLDAGSAGYYTWSGFREVAERSKAEVLGLVHLCSLGLVAWRLGELLDPRMADVEKAVAIIRQDPTLAVGVKIRASVGQIGSGEQGTQLVRMAKEAARESGTWLMVHIGSTPMSLSELVAILDPGDVITHCYKGGDYEHLVIDEKGKVFPELMEAAAAGIHFDVGHGGASFDWNVAERALEQGLLPSSISTDLHTGNVNGPVYDMPTTMTKFCMLGMSLDDVIRCSTIAPARILGRQNEIGTLRPGSTADVSLLRWVDEEATLYDSYGNARRATRLLKAAGVIKSGRIVRFRDEPPPAEISR